MSAVRITDNKTIPELAAPTLETPSEPLFDSVHYIKKEEVDRTVPSVTPQLTFTGCVVCGRS